jgi:hypothetical protein
MIETMHRASLLAAQNFPEFAKQAYGLVGALRLQFQTLQFNDGTRCRSYFGQRNSSLFLSDLVGRDEIARCRRTYGPAS